MKIAFIKGQKMNRWTGRVLTAILVVFVVSAAWANPIRVAIMPLAINAEEHLSFLKDGIPSILMSRLSWKDHVVVLNREETRAVTNDGTPLLNENDLRQIGTKLGTDYLVSGALTVLDNRMRIDIKVLNVNDRLPVRIFEKESQNMNDVISQVNEVADEINSQIFGRIRAKKDQESTPQTDSIYIHPEKLFLNQSGTSN